MQDSQTGIDFDVSVGPSMVASRHVEICRAAIKTYPELRPTVLLLKKYLAARDCHQSYSGGISSFLLFYMVLAFFQVTRDQPSAAPAFFRFLAFFAQFNERNFGLQIDIDGLFATAEH
jgi:DNA polymerase sigma